MRALLIFLLFFGSLSIDTPLSAQDPGGSNPTAPSVSAEGSADGAASISGTVLDATGAAVSGAQVSLMHMDGTQRQTLMSGADGEFTFTKLSPGSYLVIVKAIGFRPFTSTEIVITAKQVLKMPPISLLVGAVSTEVMVRPTEVLAAAQVRAEEKQRILGVVPNFYTSYIYTERLK